MPTSSERNETIPVPTISSGLRLQAQLIGDNDIYLTLSFGARGVVDVPKAAVISCTPDEGGSHFVEIMSSTKLLFKAATISGESAGIVENSMLFGAYDGAYNSSSDCDCDCQDCDRVSNRLGDFAQPGMTVFRVPV